MEHHNYRLHAALDEAFTLEPILNPKGKSRLPLFFVQALARIGRLVRPGDRVLFGDMLTASMAPLLRPFLRNVAFISCAHGTDVIWSPWVYQLWIRRFVIPRLDAIIAVSEATRQAVLNRGAHRARVHMIPNGTDPVPLIDRAVARHEIEQAYSVDLADRHVLLSIGRLVPRKGITWFVREVCPLLPQDTAMLIAGDGPDRAHLARLIADLGLQDSVYALGPVPDDTRTKLYNAANAFVMPNQPTAGDMEGFGITLLEAASAGLPVVASRLEGITDAAAAAGTVWLVTPGEREAFRRALADVRQRVPDGYAPQPIRRNIERHNSWPAVAAQYARIICETSPT